MKKLPMFVTALLVTNFLWAQAAPTCNPYPKTISVTGSAEMYVIPDEIFVQVDLKEYKKKGEDKKEIDVIKAEFLANCKAVGIADSSISLAFYDGYNASSSWRRRKKDPDLMLSVSFQIKFSNTKLIDALVSKLDDEATSNFDIVRTSHTKMTEYRRQLKVMAIKAANEKAQYLAEAVNEEVGPAITIKEPDETPAYSGSGSKSYLSIANSNVAYKGPATTDDGVGFRKIKLRYDVAVLYALK